MKRMKFELDLKEADIRRVTAAVEAEMGFKVPPDVCRALTMFVVTESMGQLLDQVAPAANADQLRAVMAVHHRAAVSALMNITRALAARASVNEAVMDSAIDETVKHVTDLLQRTLRLTPDDVVH